MREKVGFIGAGNMCHAIIEGWLAKDLLSATDVFVSNRTPGKLQKLAEQFKVHTCATNEAVVEAADVVILAVKPQDLQSAVENIASAFSDSQLIISLAAGVKLRALKKLLPQCKTIVRLMANTPVRIGRGSFAYSSVGDELRVAAFMERLFTVLPTPMMSAWRKMSSQ